MKIQIFDVSHGFCAYLIADNRNVVLFDCGHNERTGFRPSQYLPRSGCTAIEKFIITNYDEDHISDLCDLLDLLPIEVLTCNRSISVEQLERLKLENGPLTNNMKRLISMITGYSNTDYIPPDFSGIEHNVFYCSYPLLTDTNNLSLVSFIHYDGVGIIFPGDIEKKGWEELLKQERFRDNLRRTHFFVASHHGRENGYCEEVFRYCKPEIVIISDKEIVHETQKNCYAKHASGIPWNGGPERRYVLTTRSDGMITITKTLGQPPHINIGG
jgi:beta-lactamase superfamily II metal-dependent hydrolase